ncbi:MAG TPA: hypothetical protein VJ830_03955 [Anaerolineales bacterium]|nr:hypothetical protein [Anaerolineales bacterium]
MIKKLFIFVLLVTLLAACAPGASSTNFPLVTEPPAVALATATLGAAMPGSTTQIAPSEEATALPLATSRGPELHATDPASVSLASDGLQFVEFFRFT